LNAQASNGSVVELANGSRDVFGTHMADFEDSEDFQE
jgi:hypothetical protein